MSTQPTELMQQIASVLGPMISAEIAKQLESFTAPTAKQPAKAAKPAKTGKKAKAMPFIREGAKITTGGKVFAKVSKGKRPGEFKLHDTGVAEPVADKYVSDRPAKKHMQIGRSGLRLVQHQDSVTPKQAFSLETASGYMRTSSGDSHVDWLYWAALKHNARKVFANAAKAQKDFSHGIQIFAALHADKKLSLQEKHNILLEIGMNADWLFHPAK